MKNFLLIALILLAGFSAFGQKTSKPGKRIVKTTPVLIIDTREKFDPTRNSANDLQAAILKADKENKRIILDVGGEWCGWCRQMDAFIEKNAELKKMQTANFVWVKVNMSEENENKEFLANYPKVSGYPHLFVLEKDGTLLKSKDTSELEQGESYNLQKFTDFLSEYSPAKIAQK